MDTDILRGENVCLRALDPARDAEPFTRWGRDSDFARLLDSDPARLATARSAQTVLEQDQDSASGVLFAIRVLDDDRLLGFTGLDGIRWPPGDAGAVIGIGSRADWGRGYGTQAMRLLLAYAFGELGLRRVTLSVFDYNPRAIRSYEKAGFVLEGRVRQRLLRDSRRWDMLIMGLLREEWAASQDQGRRAKDQKPSPGRPLPGATDH